MHLTSSEGFFDLELVRRVVDLGANQRTITGLFEIFDDVFVFVDR